VASFCEHGNEASVCIKRVGLLHQRSDYPPLKKGSATRMALIMFYLPVFYQDGSLLQEKQII
jgi:hypothetical protein